MLIAQCNSYRINTISVYQRVSCWAQNHPEKEFLSVFMSPLSTTLMNELMFCPAVLLLVLIGDKKKQSSCLWDGLRKIKFKIQIIYSTLTVSYLMCKHRRSSPVRHDGGSLFNQHHLAQFHGPLQRTGTI